jgi:hypothetical protein
MGNGNPGRQCPRLGHPTLHRLGRAVPPRQLVPERNLPSTWRIATTDNGWTTNAVGLDWVKHSDYHIAARTKGTYRLLILDGHQSHHSTEFELYCQHRRARSLHNPKEFSPEVGDEEENL